MCNLPKQLTTSKTLLFNMSWDAARNQELQEAGVFFDARFGLQAFTVFVPWDCVQGLGVKEWPHVFFQMENASASETTKLITGVDLGGANKTTTQALEERDNPRAAQTKQQEVPQVKKHEKPKFQVIKGGAERANDAPPSMGRAKLKIIK